MAAAAVMLAACAGTGHAASTTAAKKEATTTSCGSGCGVPRVVTLSTGSGPAKKYDCVFNVATSAYTGAFGTASAIGWESNDQGVVTCLGGTFFVQEGINKDFGFGIYDGTPTTWTDADGYLPAQITSFDSSGAEVVITEFADK